MDLNVDMGESYGRYKLGNDEKVMEHVTSVNIACGFHAGDPLVIYNTVQLAKEYGVEIGAHTGLADIRGFGRRRMEVTPEELLSDTLYQLGALDGIAKALKKTIHHVKPHGILYRMVSDEEVYAQVYLKAVSLFNPKLFIYVPRGSLIWQIGLQMGLKMAAEVLIDLSYDDEGNWVLERSKEERSPDEVADRAVMVALKKQITTINGKSIKAEADTICCHGDSPNAAQVVARIKEVYTAKGIELRTV